MFLKSARIRNYKSFRDSSEIEFEDGINIIVGINNAGKTAMLEALSLTFKNQPHRNLESNSPDKSFITLTFRIDGATVEEMLIKPGAKLYIPYLNASNSVQKFIENLKSYFDISKNFTEDKKTGLISKWSHLNHETEQSELIYNYNYKHGTISNTQTGHNNPTFAEALIKAKIERIFFFKAERVKLHRSPHHSHRHLESDCSNLADVLRHFREHYTTSFDNYIEQIKRVLPNFEYLTVPTLGTSGSEIRIWTYPKELDRSDLSHSLDNCGAGVGQVLAMVYIILRLEPSIIIIDEPNSFLHPGATRELLRIFKENPQHQYFISTHSPEIFAELKPSSYNKLSYKDFETKVEKHTYREFYNDYQELGFSPFYDVALWLEGETELEVFSLILDQPNIQFFQIFSASDIAKKGALIKELDRICKVYSSLIQSRNGEPPPAKIKVVLDGEHLDSEKQTDYTRRPDNIVYFLQRKMFENYILHPRSIAEVMNEMLESKVSEQEISAWIDESNEFEKHVTKTEKIKRDYDWLKYVHGANLLTELFNTKGLTYGKTNFSVEITKRIIKNENKFLDPLRKEILPFLSKAQTPPKDLE